MPKPPTGISQYIHVDPSPLARRLFWHVLGMGARPYAESVPHQPLDKPGGSLIWLGGGGGQLQVGPHNLTFQRGPHFWLINLQQPRVFTPPAGQTLIIQSIRFSGPELDIWLETLGTAEQPQFQLSEKEAGGVYATQRRLAHLVTKRPPLWEWEVHLTISLLLQKFLLARQLLAPGPTELPAEITRGLDALAADPYRDWRASELAEHVGLDYSMFRAMFRKHLHESIHEYLQRTRLHQAEVLLSDPRLRVKEVAQRLHFRSEHYFSHFFHQRTGMTPTEYRTHIGNRPIK